MSKQCQHTKPCKGCPFSRNTEPGSLGGSAPEVYIGQSEGPFWLPCHNSKGYRGNSTNYGEVTQCAGAAIYRSKIGVADKMPAALLTLDADNDEVFNSHAEFLAHHSGLTLEEAEELTTPDVVQELALIELFKGMIKGRTRKAMEV